VIGSRPTSSRATSAIPAVAALGLSLLEVDSASLAAWREAWRGLEQRSSDTSPFTTYDWVQAWVETYRPQRLLLAHVVERSGGSTVALGLFEVSRLREWSFAGGEVTPRRSLLCASGYADAAWRALAQWLQANPRAWSTLDAREVAEVAAGVPGARLTATRTPCLALPDSFESYLASLPSKRRSDLRRRLRLTEQAGVEVRRVPEQEMERAIADFLRLHEQRASAKAEHHANVDDRLGRLLAQVCASETIDLSVLEIRQDEITVATNVCLEHAGVLYPYSHGWDPRGARLAPGIVMALDFIRDASSRGLSRIDLGPGEQDYKAALGAVPSRRLTLQASNPAIWARTVRSAYATYERLRG
jgi:CelD/BcsL family acetyltransferase involved in cellulose biosynthesis